MNERSRNLLEAEDFLLLQLLQLEVQAKREMRRDRFAREYEREKEKKEKKKTTTVCGRRRS